MIPATGEPEMGATNETTFLKATPGEIPLGDGIHVWRIFPDVSDVGLLSDSEREQAERFRSQEARATFVSGRSGLRRIVSGYTGIPSRDLLLAVAPGGKPYFANAGIAFNLSHSGPTVVAAFSRTAVGIDIESYGRCKDFVGIAERYFHPSEVAALVRTRDEGQFLRLWTGKEAMLKLSGDGLSGGLLDARPGDENSGFLGENTVSLSRFSFERMLGTVASFEPHAVKGWFRL